MKRNYLPVLMLLVFVSLACGIGKDEDEVEEVIIPTLAPTTQLANAPTTPPIVVEEEVEEEPVEEQVEEQVSEPPAGSPYYTEEFDSDQLPTWFPQITNGDINQVEIFTKNGKLVFSIGGTDTYMYLINEAYNYSDVRLDIEVENRGSNTNNVGLICRFNEDGWYEYVINSNGMYELWSFTPDIGYDMIHQGGSKHIRVGKAINQYTVICNGDRLTLFINGVDTHTQTDRTLRDEGLVGVAVSSTYAIPVEVEFEYFTVSQP